MRPYIAVAAAGLIWSSASAQSIRERDANIQSGISPDGIVAAAGMIKAHGYSCRSVSSMTRHNLSAGFRVCCEKFSYCYSLRDRGGKWEVKVD